MILWAFIISAGLSLAWFIFLVASKAQPALTLWVGLLFSILVLLGVSLGWWSARKIDPDKRKKKDQAFKKFVLIWGPIIIILFISLWFAK